MSDDKLVLEPPSYSDSLLSNAFGNRFDSLSRLNLNRTLHINATIDNLIAPIVDSRLGQGLNSTTIALIPTSRNISSPTSIDYDFKTIPSEIIGLASDHDLDAQLDMTDPMDSKVFWMQIEVIAELEQKISQRWCPSAMQSETQGLLEQRPGITKIPIEAQQDRTAVDQRPTGLFSRLSSKQSRSEATTQYSPRKVEAPHRVPVKVKLDEICFRTVSSFGLYETIVKPAVLISIDIMC